VEPVVAEVEEPDHLQVCLLVSTSTPVPSGLGHDQVFAALGAACDQIQMQMLA
jgi:hypothetical protein